MRRTRLWWIVPAVVIFGAMAWSQIVSNVEQAKYQVILSEGNFEIRDYAPMIVAKTDVFGERKAAINEGFRVIADYIFGNNGPKKNVAMTAPVIQQQKISMTAPVTQQGSAGQWTVRFVMPAAYTMDTLPKPNNNAVVLEQVPGKRFAVIRFSGLSSEASLKDHTAELSAFILDKKLKILSEPSYAFFNPPWTLPFLRRNEVMIEIASE